MNGQILCALLAQRIPPAQFQVHGETVVFMDAQYDTPDNQAIVADVVANYATLAPEYAAASDRGAVLSNFRNTREILLARMTGVRVNDISPSDTTAINALTTMRTSLKDLPGIASVTNAVGKAATETAVTNEWNAIKSTFISSVPTQESIFTGLSPF